MPTNNAINAGGPGTAGHVLQSTVSGPPAYSTATYPATASTSGNVLTSDGTNFVSSALASTFTPNSVIRESDDFLSIFDFGTVGVSKLNWYNYANRYQPVTSTLAHPGVIGAAQSASLSLIGLTSGSTFLSMMFLGGGAISINYVLNVTTLSTAGNRYATYIGFMGADSVSGLTAPTNGCYFSYVDNVNSGNWRINCTSASTTTSTNTAVAADTSYHNFGITVNAAGTSVSFTIDGVAVGTIATNIPSTAISPSVLVTGSTPVAVIGALDLFYMTQTLTTPR